MHADGHDRDKMLMNEYDTKSNEEIAFFVMIGKQCAMRVRKREVKAQSENMEPKKEKPKNPLSNDERTVVVSLTPVDKPCHRG